MPEVIKITNRESIALNSVKAKELISILMESQLYFSLSVPERHLLIKKLLEEYQVFLEKDKEMVVS